MPHRRSSVGGRPVSVRTMVTLRFSVLLCVCCRINLYGIKAAARRRPRRHLVTYLQRTGTATLRAALAGRARSRPSPHGEATD